MPKLTAKFQCTNETQSGPVPYKGLPLRQQRGQALLEYALVVLAVALTFMSVVVAILTQLEGG